MATATADTSASLWPTKQRDDIALLYMAATMDDTTNSPSANQLAIEHVGVDNIGTQLINIESVLQMIRGQVRKLEGNGIETAVLELKSLLPKLDGLQDSLRKTLDEHARSLTHKLHILNLPDELLRKIFEEVRGDFDSTYQESSEDGVSDIKSLRLTCRRFCDASSHLLLHHVDVSLANSSLEHLDEVSRHPTISKGIRSLQINISLYEPTRFCSSLKGFIDGVVKQLRSDHERASASMRLYTETLGNDQTFGAARTGDYAQLSGVVETMKERNDILWACMNYLRAEASQADGDQIIATLSEVYEKYSQLVEDQNALLCNDTFVASVAEAVTRVPTVARLVIIDWEHCRFHHEWAQISSPIYPFVRKMPLNPSSWNDSLGSLLKQRSLKLLCQLLPAALRAGNPLTELYLHVSSTEDNNMKLSMEQVRGLVSAAEHLEVLDTNCQLAVQPTQYEHPSRERVSISRLASLFLNGTKLRSVNLDYVWTEVGCLKAEPSIASLPWSNLEKLSLVFCIIPYDELSKYLQKLAPGTCILLTELHLFNGLWAEWADLLDVIRSKADCHSNVISPEDLGGWQDEFYEKFATSSREESLATAYIRGQIAENPLRSPSDQDNMDTEDMEEEN